MAIKIVFGMLLLGLIAYLAGFFLPQSYEVTRTVVIAAPRAEIHAALEDVTRWKDWSAFVPSGESAQLIESHYEGPGAGAGAIWYWGKDLENKPARLEVVTSDVNWGIAYTLQLDGGRVKSSGDILLQEQEGGTLVTFANGGELASPWRRYFALVANKAVGPALQQSLDGLKKSLEATPAASTPAGTGQGASSDAQGNANSPEPQAAGAAGH